MKNGQSAKLGKNNNYWYTLRQTGIGDPPGLHSDLQVAPLARTIIHQTIFIRNNNTLI